MTYPLDDEYYTSMDLSVDIQELIKDSPESEYLGELENLVARLQKDGLSRKEFHEIEDSFWTISDRINTVAMLQDDY